MERRMNKFASERKTVVENTGLVFFTWSMLVVLFWDFNEGIDLYDAIIQALTF